MTTNFKITINGNVYAASPGQTILDVARANQIDNIPTLCWDPKLPAYGSCYLCVVEVKGLEKLVPSCSSPAADGMVVETDNARIRESRKTALELLLSNHYADCLGPCTQTCPAGVDVQGYIALMAMGKFTEAVKLIKETNPLPIVCGRVCVRECEAACRRNKVDERVGIDYLKRYAADIDLEHPWTPELAPANGRKVAVVGGGPAGLTCAYFLTLKGYSVTLNEASPHLGGMLRYGIPEYRLPKKTLDREIKWITDLGVTVKTKSVLGKNFTIASLKKDGFDAIFLALGAQAGKAMGIKGEDETPGVIRGADFLRQLQGTKVPEIYGNVVVVGGGNTAIDAARSAMRMGANKVTLLYRRTKKEMPAHEMEIDAALEEGVELIQLSAPVGIVKKKDGRLTALTCIRMELGEPDASGRRSPVAKKGSEYNLKADFAISAIGQDIDLGAINRNGNLKTKWGNVIVTKEGTLETSIPGVFAGGDVITGPAVAIDAIAHGKIAADAIERYIVSGSPEEQPKGFISRKDSYGEIPESEFTDFAKIKKEKMSEMDVAERIKSLKEVELGFTEEQMANECSRCLECGCSEYFDCALRKYASEFGVNITRFVGDVRRHKIDTTHPFITLDPNKCINCGRCIRTCSEVIQASALGFVNRGFKSVMKPAMEKKLLETTCISCGNCIAACPTGAISEKLPFPKPGPWASEKVESVCAFCSVGCNVGYKVFADHTFTIQNLNGSSHNKGYLCSKGRWGYRYMLESDRLTKPMVRKNRTLREAGWDQALEYAADRLKSVIKAHGPQSVAVFGSPRMTNEELYLLQKFVRTGLKTNNIGSFTNIMNGAGQDALDGMFGITASTATMDDIKKADVVVVINSNLSEDNLIAGLKVKEAQKTGTRLATVSSAATPLARTSNLWIKPKRGTNTVLINGISKAVINAGSQDKEFVEKRTEGFKAFMKSLSKADVSGISAITGVTAGKLTELLDLVANRKHNVVILYSIDSSTEKSKNDLKALANLLMLTGRVGKPGNGIVILRDFANSQGLFDMGADSRYLPGNVGAKDTEGIKRVGAFWGTDMKGVFKPVDLRGAMEKGKFKALVIFGEDPLREKTNKALAAGAEFILVVDTARTATVAKADVVLPASLPVETSGTTTACDRRVQKVTKVFPSLTGLETWQIITKLAGKFGMPGTYKTSQDVFKEIKKVNPAYRTVVIGSFWGKDFLKKAFLTVDGKGRFMALPADTTPENTAKKPYLYSEKYYENQVKGRLRT
ncbi:MAG: molybdopterin-dependent oxidoreductase [Syntrophobacterales bacterium]|jgi:formate dehydrogenase major subunit|nr:molybdopterin-dependent oxidoreductase [Syntrophobacterales bacterium]